jgi:iron complex transport system substrate-binding protein
MRPERIICLSAEAADWLWRIGAWNRVVGVTGFFKAPPGLEPKPRVGGFSSAHLETIVSLEPDLIISFSDVQAQLAAELIRAGLTVLATNQRTLAEVEETLGLIGRVVGCEAQAQMLLGEFRQRLAPVPRSESRPRVYFEEWNGPLVAGIAWVSELIELAGGADVFSNLRTKRAAAERSVSDAEVCAADPQLILASWCGKPVKVSEILMRVGWADVAAVRCKRVFEIPSEDILQPGFRLTYGYEQIKERIGTLIGADQTLIKGRSQKYGDKKI